MTPAYLLRLGLDQQTDERVIRRAYARELKQIDQEDDPAACQALREAYEAALGWAQRQQPAAATAQHDVAAAAESAESAVPSEAVAPSDVAEPPAHARQANAAFSAFAQRTAIPGAALDSSAYWQTQLEHCLDELVSIEAREWFEYHIATLLAQGWHPGHEMLLVAAAAVFNWQQDRRRLYNLGTAGAMLDRALEEHAMFSLQSEKARAQQSKLIGRLRNPQAPSAGELIGNRATLAWLQANYSTWLSIISNTEAIPRWQQAYDALPNWRRKLSPSGWSNDQSDAWELQTSFSWKWLWVLLIVGLLRMCVNFGSDKPKPPPAPAQQSAPRPKLSGDYLKQGDTYLQDKKFAQAIDSYDRVIERTPNNYMAWIGRGQAHLGLGDEQQAQQDFDQSASLDNDNHALHAARGRLAMLRGQPAEAVAAYTKAIALLPAGNVNLLSLRAEAYDHLGDRQHALDDVNALIKTGADLPWVIYKQRLRLLMQLGQTSAANTEAEAMLARFPLEANAYNVVAGHYRDHGMPHKARAAIERGIAALPQEAHLLLIRATLRAADDLQGRRADIVRAGQLDPLNILAVEQRVDLEIKAGNLSAAADFVAKASQRWPADYTDWPMVLALRGVVAAKQGNRSAAEQDFSDALKAASTAAQMNNVCWIMAVRNVSLPTALFICDAALELRPGNLAVLDSRGLVLLRMGRNQEALDSYQAAISGNSNHAHSLAGRGIARRGLGDQASGQADIQAALRLEPGLRQVYASYGVKL